MKNHVRHLCSLLGLLAVAIYIAMTITAWTFYPAAFGPNGNWLSDLGNNDLNPGGALLYRLGGILGGIGLAGFFLSLDGRAWGSVAPSGCSRPSCAPSAPWRQRASS